MTPEPRRPRAGRGAVTAGILLAAGAVFAAPLPLLGQSADWYELSSRRQTDGVEALDVDIEYVAGRLEVGTVEPGLLYRLDLGYDAARLEPVREWEVEGDEGRLGLRFRGHDHVELGDLEDMEHDELGSLSLGLSREIPTRLSLDVIAAEARLELGGAALRELTYRTGASQSTISFDAPNPVRMERIDLAAGAAEFEAAGLGNARFDRLLFAGAVGDVRLDFGGRWDGSAEGEINVGLGALRLVFPRDLGVRIEKGGIFSSFDDEGFENVDGAYVTPNWASAAHRLTLSIRAGFGDIDVTFRD